MSLSQQEIYQLGCQLIAQSPPGEVNDVIQDLQIILASQAQINSDPEILPYIVEHLTQYNIAQFLAVPGKDGYQTIVSKPAEIEGGRYADPRAQKSFKLNHRTLVASELEDYVIPEHHELFRAQLDLSLQAYTTSHYTASSSTVFCSSKPLKPKVFTSSVDTAAPISPLYTDSKEVDSLTADPDKEESFMEKAAAEESSNKDLVQTVVEEAVEEVKAVVEGDSNEQAEEEREDSKPLNQDAEAKQDILGDKPIAAPSISDLVDARSSETDPSTKQDESLEQANDSVPTVVSGEKTDQKDELSQEDPVYTIQIVSNKYNTSNFWTGRWRSEYVVDPKIEEVTGKIWVDVHYFEAGNVQLQATNTVTFPMPEDSPSRASQIITSVAKAEQAYQLQLNEIYGDLGDKAFRSLRRALPVTRQKVDWDKISAYKMGKGTSLA